MCEAPAGRSAHPTPCMSVGLPIVEVCVRPVTLVFPVGVLGRSSRGRAFDLDPFAPSIMFTFDQDQERIMYGPGVSRGVPAREI